MLCAFGSAQFSLAQRGGGVVVPLGSHVGTPHAKHLAESGALECEGDAAFVTGIEAIVCCADGLDSFGHVFACGSWCRCLSCTLPKTQGRQRSDRRTGCAHAGRGWPVVRVLPGAHLEVGEFHSAEALLASHETGPGHRDVQPPRRHAHIPRYVPAGRLRLGHICGSCSYHRQGAMGRPVLEEEVRDLAPTH